MQLQTIDEVWARIDAHLRAQPGGVLATDGDGTLWSGDVGHDLFASFLEHGRVEPVAVDALRRVAAAHDLSDAGSGVDVARTIYAAYLEDRFPELPVCEVMTWCFAGWTRGEVQAFARDTLDRAGLAGRLHGEALAVITRAREAGAAIVVVSASPVAVVVDAAGRAGLGDAQIVAARPAYDGEGDGARMLAAVEPPIPYGAGKVERLRERIGHDRLLYAALGDNVFDIALLASARVPIAVRPKPKLRERAAEVPGLVELGR